MWTVKSQPKSYRLTHSLAKRFAEMTPAPNDRPMLGSRMMGLRGIIDEGNFRTCEWASAYCKQTKETYRVNGKHTSNIFASMNGESPKNVHVIISEYECDDLEDVAKLYCSFDTRQSVRSPRDICRIYAASNPNLTDLPLKSVSNAVSGIAYVLWEQDSRNHTAEERASLMLDHPDFVVWYSDIVGSDKKSNINRSPVAAAMFKTFEKSHADSTDFWTLVRDASGSNNKTPDRVLSRYLDKTSINAGLGVKTKKERCSPREMFVKCIHAWNAWRKDATTDLKYHAAAKTPAAV